MAILNSNNPLIWQGSFNETPAELEAVADTIFINVNETSATLYPLSNDTSNYGIDYSSFTFNYQDNPTKPARFNHSSGLLTYYPRLPLTNGQIRTLKYKWQDIKGNESNEAIVSINVTDRPLGWRVVEDSAFCLLNSEQRNTGYLGYAELEHYYTDDDTAVDPPQVKPNISSDPDYIAPIFNDDVCPVNGTTEPSARFISELMDEPVNYARFEANQEFRDATTGELLYNPDNGSSWSPDTLVTIGEGVFDITVSIFKGPSASLIAVKIIDNRTGDILGTKVVTTSPVGTYTFNDIEVSKFGIKLVIFRDTV